MATKGPRVSRKRDVEQLYEGLTVLARRSRELGAELHPGLTLVEFSLLTFIATTPGTRGADIASSYGLDKSTVSRQIDQMVAGGLLLRGAEVPGRRGQTLTLTPAGEDALRLAADSVHVALVDRLAAWGDRDVADFARLVARFNDRADAG
jgi:DNA-binding MarR family transcriptional regulator